MAVTRTKLISIATAAVLVAVASFWIWGDWLHTFGVTINGNLPTQTITVGGARVVVELASTPAAQEQGLSGRAALPAGRGMLFDMGSNGRWGFWMEDMLISIDMVWLAEDGTIVDIAPNVAPESYPEIFRPSAPARYVLEVPAGYMAAIGIGVGDTIVL